MDVTEATESQDVPTEMNMLQWERTSLHSCLDHALSNCVTLSAGGLLMESFPAGQIMSGQFSG